MSEYHVVVGVDYAEGYSGVLPFYGIPADSGFVAIEKTMGAIRELHEAGQFEVRTIDVRPAPGNPLLDPPVREAIMTRYREATDGD